MCTRIVELIDAASAMRSNATLTDVVRIACDCCDSLETCSAAKEEEISFREVLMRPEPDSQVQFARVASAE